MVNYRPLNHLVPWCSGLTCGPVKAEIAGSNPVGTASSNLRDTETSEQIVQRFFVLNSPLIISLAESHFHFHTERAVQHEDEELIHLQRIFSLHAVRSSPGRMDFLLSTPLPCGEEIEY